MYCTRQLSLFPDPDEHFAYVAMANLEWPDEAIGYCVRCPADGCVFMRWTVFASFDVAYSHALSHRRRMLEQFYVEDLPSE